VQERVKIEIVVQRGKTDGRKPRIGVLAVTSSKGASKKVIVNNGKSYSVQ